jgi:four helix bundle protein
MLPCRCSKIFFAEERYSLVDEVRLSSRAVAANIAEAWRKRRYPAAFVNKLNDAEGEAAETQTHIEIALRCGYLPQATFEKLNDELEQALAMLVTMASQPDKWKIRR